MAKFEAFDQTKNFFSKLTASQKIVISGAVAAVLAGIVLLFAFSKPKPETAVLFSSLESQDASKIVSKLKEKQIKYELSDNGTSIYVDKNQVYETRLSLAGEGLPEQSTVGYEIFDRTNLGMSEFVQKLNYRRALEGELARTIASLDEVKKVRVHIVIPEKALFEKDQKQPTASVQLTLKSTKTPTKTSIEGIQNLVASSVEGMNTASVMVVDQKGRTLSEKPIDGKSVAGLTSQQYEQKKNVDQYLTDKVQTMLDGVLGPGNSEATVATELDFTQTETIETRYNNSGQVARSEQSTSDNTLSIDSLSSRYDSLYNHTLRNGRNQNNTISNYEIPQTVEKKIDEVGKLKRMSVAVLINGMPTVQTVAGKKVYKRVEPNDEYLRKIENIVKNAVGFNIDRQDQIKVDYVPFDPSIGEPETEVQPEVKWWQNPDIIKLLALFAAMITAIMLMYRLLRSKHVKEQLRIAMNLPEHPAGLLGPADEPDEEELEELILSDDDSLFLPTEMPEQLLLEGDRNKGKADLFPDEDLLGFGNLTGDSLINLRNSSGFDLSEDTQLKVELKSKIKDYFDSQTHDAVRLFRIILSQETEEK